MRRSLSFRLGLLWAVSLARRRAGILLLAALLALLAVAACRPAAPTVMPTPPVATAPTIAPSATTARTAAPAAAVTLTPTASPTLRPSPTTTPVVAHRWQAAPVLVELYEHGFMIAHAEIMSMPAIVVYADGRVIRSTGGSSYRTVTEWRLPRDAVCALLGQIEADGFFDFKRRDYDTPGVYDVGMTFITVNSWRRRAFVADALTYVLNSADSQDVPRGLVDTYWHLLQFSPSGGTPYRPERIIVWVSTTGGPNPLLEWPLADEPLSELTARQTQWDEGVVVEGEKALEIYDAMGDRHSRDFQEDGVKYSVDVRPMLPFEVFKPGWNRQAYAYLTEPTIELECPALAISAPTSVPTTPVPVAPLRLAAEIGRHDGPGQMYGLWSFVITPRDEIVVNDYDFRSYPLRQRLAWFALDGTFVRRLSLPPDDDRAAYGLANGIDGTILVAYSGHDDVPDRVLEVAPDGTIVRTLEGWPAPEPDPDRSTRLDNIAQGPDGAIYLTEACGKRVVVLHLDGRLREIWNGPQADPFTCVNAVAIDSHGTLYVADYDAKAGSRLLLRTAAGEVHALPIDAWGGIVPLEDGSFYTSSGEGVVYYSPAGEELARPRVGACAWADTLDLAVASDGSLIIDGAGGVLQRCTLDGSLLATIGATELLPGQFESHDAFAVSARGDIWLIDSTDSYENPAGARLVHLDAGGQLLATFDDVDGDPLAGENYHLAAHSDGSVFLVDADTGVIRQIGPDGQVLRKWNHPGGPGSNHDIALAPDERSLYIADWRNARVQQFSLEGKLLSTWKSTLGGTVAVTANESGTMYVLESAGQRVVMIPASGDVRTWALPSLPHARTILVSSIAVDAARGRVYVTANSNLVYVFDREGVFLGAAPVGSGEIDYAHRDLMVACGPGGRVYVSTGGDRVYVYEPVP